MHFTGDEKCLFTLTNFSFHGLEPLFLRLFMRYGRVTDATQQHMAHAKVCVAGRMWIVEGDLVHEEMKQSKFPDLAYRNEPTACLHATYIITIYHSAHPIVYT